MPCAPSTLPQRSVTATALREIIPHIGSNPAHREYTYGGRVAHCMSVDRSEYQRLTSDIDATHDLAARLRLYVACFIGCRRRPHGIIFFVAPLDFTRVPTSAKRKNKPLFCNDQTNAS